MSTTPRGWVGDLQFGPAVLPDVVNVQLIVQVGLWDRDRKQQLSSAWRNLGEDCKAQPPQRAGKEDKELLSCIGRQQLFHWAGNVLSQTLSDSLRYEDLKSWSLTQMFRLKLLNSRAKNSSRW